MVKIRPRVLKQWRTVSPEELQKTYLSRYQHKEPAVKSETSWVDELEKFKSKPYEAGEPISHEKAKFMETYGDYTEPHIVDLSKEEIGRIATKIENDILTKRIGKTRNIFKKVILDKRELYLTDPAKPKIGAKDWIKTSPVLTKAILNIRKTTQPKVILTEAGKAKDIQRIRIEAAVHKIARERAETFKTEAAKSGLPVERIGDLEKKFIKKTKRGMVKAPVSSETAITMGFPGKGTKYDPYGIGTANEMLLEFGAMPKGNPKLRHPFQRRDFKSEIDFEVAKDRWKNIPVRGTFIKHRPDQPFPEVIKVTGHTKHKGYISRKPDPRADQIFAGQKATRIVGTSRLTPSGRIIPEVEWQKHKTKWFKAQPKRTKPEIGYAVTKSEWSKRNKRLENEFIKGLERRKGPFHWE